MREIPDVVKAMLVDIPEDQVEFRERLQKISNDDAYRPPEDKMPSWRRMQDAVLIHIGEVPTRDWEFKVASTYSLIPEDTIRRRVAEFTGAEKMRGEL